MAQLWCSIMEASSHSTFALSSDFWAPPLLTLISKSPTCHRRVATPRWSRSSSSWQWLGSKRSLRTTWVPQQRLLVTFFQNHATGARDFIFSSANAPLYPCPHRKDTRRTTRSTRRRQQVSSAPVCAPVNQQSMCFSTSVLVSVSAGFVFLSRLSK